MAAAVEECIIGAVAADLEHHFSSRWVEAEALGLEEAVAAVSADSVVEVSEVVELVGIGRRFTLDALRFTLNAWRLTLGALSWEFGVWG